MKIRRVVLSVAELILTLCFCVGCRDNARETAGLIGPTSNPVWVIDAGHGGEDGGAVSSNGMPESQINLAIAKRLDLILGLCGIRTVLLRDQDVSLHSEDAKTLRQKKNSDLHNRVNMVNAQENASLISIHQNTYPDSRYSGAQAFFAPTPGSRELAQHMQESLRSVLDPQNARLEKQIPETIFLMNHIICPGVLVECGFLTNPQEEMLLRENSYQTKVALALAGGCLTTVTQEERNA